VFYTNSAIFQLYPKITHYCQEGKTFSVLLLHIIKKRSTRTSFERTEDVRKSIFQLFPDKRSCPCLYGANQVSRIQGTCSKGTDETVRTKFVTVTGGQTGQKAIHVYLPWKWGGGRHNYSIYEYLRTSSVLSKDVRVLLLPLLHVPCILDT
jgi:hypothetical protein